MLSAEKQFLVWLLCDIVELFYDLDLIKNSNQENVCIRNIQCLLEKNVLNTK